MSIREIDAKSLLRRHKRIDSWFVSHYGLNQYRGCTHNCAYCDGRAEGYYVEGEFGRDISVKTNSADLLRRELDPARKRKPLPRGFIMLGGGVGDSYQPVEVKYRLTRGLLGVVRDFDWPVHLLTKSVLVERDLDLLTAINHQSRALVSFSLSAINDDLAARFEPGVPSPSERLAALKRLHEAGISGGVFLMPVIPHVSDLPEQITEAVAAIKAAGADFVKTSTGFGPGGATEADVALMRRVVGPSIGIKAAGGVGSLADAQAMIAAGATRIGASAGVRIVKEAGQ